MKGKIWRAEESKEPEREGLMLREPLWAGPAVALTASLTSGQWRVRPIAPLCCPTLLGLPHPCLPITRPLPKLSNPGAPGNVQPFPADR